jgi:Rha family phage regulatory protein
MNELITITQSQTMSSLQIAELTGKKHQHVLRDIRNLIEQGCTETNFGLSEYIDPTGRTLPCYQLTKTGCLILASGYNAVLREKIINRWIELETANANQYQVPTSFREALLLAAAQQEQIEEQQKLLLAQGEQIAEKDKAIAELHERTSYLDQILQSKSTVTTTQIAQDYGMSAKKFNIELRNLKIQRKVGGQWILYAPYNTMGYVHSETFIPDNSTTGKVIMISRWTQKGRLFLYEILKKNGVLPLIER